ncbi:TonB family protein [Calothrix sp. PCC 7507]|nr:TonB family protein [Calothrix sp. PCC 7507]
MAMSDNFQRSKSEQPTDVLFGLATSFLLHSILLFWGNYWLTSAALEQKQKFSQAIPIEYVEVPPEEAKPPKETSKRAANDSVTGGKITRLQDSVVPKNLSAQKQQTKQAEIAATPTRTQPAPIPTPTEVALASPPAPTPEKIAVTPTRTQPAPIPTPTEVAPASPSVAKPKKIAVTPINRQPTPTPTDFLPQRTRVTPAKTPGLPKTPSSPQPPLKSGAASSLGGPISLSSRDLGDNYAAALTNSSRVNPAANGVDARQDTNLGPYLKELQRKVKEQWLPTLTQSSRQSVLHFTIQRSGQVSNLRISQSSYLFCMKMHIIIPPCSPPLVRGDGDSRGANYMQLHKETVSGFSVTDETALSAVKRAAPFVPLPATYRENDLQIEFTFSINVYGELDISGGS